MGCLKLSVYDEINHNQGWVSHLKVVGMASNLNGNHPGESTGRIIRLESGYPYSFNGMEKDNDITGIDGTDYTALNWEYDSRLGRRWNIDPKVKSWESPYGTFSNNPIWKVDPFGDDDYYSFSGKYLGSIGTGTAIRVVNANQDRFTNTLKDDNGAKSLEDESHLVTVQTNPVATMDKMMAQSNNADVEVTSYVILNTKDFTLSIEQQPVDPENTNVLSKNNYATTRINGDPTDVADMDVSKVIVGELHTHPGKLTPDYDPNETHYSTANTVNQETSGYDAGTAAKMNVPVYAIDNGKNAHKVEPNGKTKDIKDKNTILKDALETHGQKPEDKH